MNHRRHTMALAAIACVLTVWATDATAAGEAPGLLGKAPRKTDILVEAEDMQAQEPHWVAREHQPGWGGAASRSRALYGGAGGPSIAKAAVNVASAGPHRLWVRYLDYLPARGPMSVKVIQSDATVAETTLDATSPRAAEEAGKQWPVNVLFVWQSIDMQLAAGSCEIQLSKVDPTTGPNPQRIVDCFLLTADLAYKPDIQDFNPPLYLKVVMGKDNIDAGVIMHLFGYDGTGHHDIAMTQTFSGVAVSASGLKDALHAGDETPWVNIAPWFPGDKATRVNFDLCPEYWQFASRSDFTLVFSKTPSEDGLIRRYPRTGPGSGLMMIINVHQPDDMRSALEWSRACRAEADKLPTPIGRRPTKFPVLTAVAHHGGRALPEVLDNDLYVTAKLGMSGLIDPQFDASWLKRHRFSNEAHSSWFPNGPCFAAIDREQIHKQLEKSLKDQEERGIHLTMLRVGEEVGTEHADLAHCPKCTVRFHEYLRGLKLTPADLLGDEAPADVQAAWDAIHPVLTSTANPRLFYHSVQFRSQLYAEYTRQALEEVQLMRPGALCGANTTTDLTTNRNMLYRGIDWHRMYRQNAWNLAFIQDANAFVPSFQLVGYQFDHLRAACKYNGQPTGTFNMINRIPWDVAAKTFAEIGHGCRVMVYYDYGPYHSDAPDPQSHVFPIYPALAEVNHAIGAAEDDLLAATVRPSKVALLHSITSETWDLVSPRDTAGAEAQGLYLLLRHLGYPVDVLNEDDILEGAAGPYELIVLTGSHLRDGVAEKLMQWVQAGGVLFLAPNAASFNQYNQPATTFDSAGLHRDAFVFKDVPGWSHVLHQQPVLRKMSAEHASFAAVSGFQAVKAETTGKVLMRFDDSSPSAVGLTVGRGRVISCGFFLGIDYCRQALSHLREDQKAHPLPVKDWVTWDPIEYPQAHRDWVAGQLVALTYRPPVRSSHYLVEACLLEGKDSVVVVLSNWSAKAQTVQIDVDAPFQVGEPRAILHAPQQVSVRGQTVRFTLDVTRGDFVIVPRR